MTQAVNHKMNNKKSSKQMPSSIYILGCLHSSFPNPISGQFVCQVSAGLFCHYRLKPINVCELEPWEIVSSGKCFKLGKLYFLEQLFQLKRLQQTELISEY
jgi:hypothetical protein